MYRVPKLLGLDCVLFLVICVSQVTARNGFTTWLKERRVCSVYSNEKIEENSKEGKNTFKDKGVLCSLNYRVSSWVGSKTKTSCSQFRQKIVNGLKAHAKTLKGQKQRMANRFVKIIRKKNIYEITSGLHVMPCDDFLKFLIGEGMYGEDEKVPPKALTKQEGCSWKNSEGKELGCHLKGMAECSNFVDSYKKYLFFPGGHNSSPSLTDEEAKSGSIAEEESEGVVSSVSVNTSDDNFAKKKSKSNKYNCMKLFEPLDLLLAERGFE